MSSSRRLSPHSDRYPKGQGGYRRIKKRNLAGLMGDFVDIACIDTGAVWINCWPAPENHGEQSGLDDVGIKCRRWGRFGNVRAAVMPFRMTAGHEDEYKIQEFRIDLTVDENPDDSSATQGARRQRQTPADLGDGVHLLDVPRPQKLVGRCHAHELADSSIPWKFSSRSVTDTSTGKARTARWTWTSNNNDPEMLHAAVVVAHPGQRFYLTCAVQGQAYKGRAPFKFSNQSQADKRWFVDPKMMDDDLRSCIDGLESQIIEMTFGALESTKKEPKDQTLISAVSATSDVPRTYGPLEASGTARVLQGDIITNNYYSQAGPSGWPSSGTSGSIDRGSSQSGAPDWTTG